ncbi:peptidase inhibitor family I36 protein [Streptomyces sp. GTA36]
MRRSIRTRLGAIATVVTVGAALSSGTSAVAAPAANPGVKANCSQFTLCGWTGINFNGLGATSNAVDPGDCKTLSISARSAINYTYQTQRLWTGRGCTGLSWVLSPGESASNMGAARRYLGGY